MPRPRQRMAGVPIRRHGASQPPREPGYKEKEIPGNDLLSRPVARAVPSAQTGLTAVFGMGTGVTPSLWSPDISLYKRKMKSAKCVTMTRLRMSHVAGAMRHRAALHDGGAQCECRVQVH